MNRISKIITEQMRKLKISEYRMAKDLNLIQQSLNKSLKLNKSWQQAVILWKICRYLGLSPEAVIADETPTKLSKENSLLREKLADSNRKNRSLTKQVNDLKKLFTSDK